MSPASSRPPPQLPFRGIQFLGDGRDKLRLVDTQPGREWQAGHKIQPESCTGWDLPLELPEVYQYHLGNLTFDELMEWAAANGRETPHDWAQEERDELSFLSTLSAIAAGPDPTAVRDPTGAYVPRDQLIADVCNEMIVHKVALRNQWVTKIDAFIEAGDFAPAMDHNFRFTYCVARWTDGRFFFPLRSMRTLFESDGRLNWDSDSGKTVSQGAVSGRPTPGRQTRFDIASGTLEYVVTYPANWVSPPESFWDKVQEFVATAIGVFKLFASLFNTNIVKAGSGALAGANQAVTAGGAKASDLEKTRNAQAATDAAKGFAGFATVTPTPTFFELGLVGQFVSPAQLGPKPWWSSWL